MKPTEFTIDDIVIFKDLGPKNRRAYVVAAIRKVGNYNRYSLVALSGSRIDANPTNVQAKDIKLARNQILEFIGDNADYLVDLYNNINPPVSSTFASPTSLFDDFEVFEEESLDPHAHEPGSEADTSFSFGANAEIEDEEDLPYHILDEPEEDEEELPPLVKLSRHPYRFWLDAEFTIPLVVYSKKLGKHGHMGTDNTTTITKTLKILKLQNIPAFCDYTVSKRLRKNRARKSLARKTS